MAEVFKDTKKFSSKAGQEISQAFQSLGLDIEYVDLAVVKVCIIHKFDPLIASSYHETSDRKQSNFLITSILQLAKN